MINMFSPKRKSVPMMRNTGRGSGNRQTVLNPIDFAATLLEGKVKYQKLPSGSSDYMEFYDKNGETQGYSYNQLKQFLGEV